MKKTILKKSSYWLSVAAASLVLGVSLQFVRAWTEPTTTAPGGNLGAPINTGATGQEKTGTLTTADHRIKSSWPTLYLDRTPTGYGTTGIAGDGSSALYYTGAHSTVTQLIMRDVEGTQYGRFYGSGDGAYFGLLDGDGNWSYLAAKDNYTQFRINDAAIMTLGSAGNVGIGTTSPSQKLDVAGNIGVSGRVYAGVTSADYNPSGGNWNYTVQLNGQDTTSIGFHDAGASVSSIKYSNAGFVIGGDDGWGAKNVNFPGNVGIGITAPTSKLDVSGDIRANGGWLRNNGNQGWYNDTYGSGLYMADSSWIRSYGNAGLWFNNATIGTNGNLSIGYGGGAGPAGGAIISGNVGIGTTTPAQKLDVNGNIKGTGLCIGTDCKTSWITRAVGSVYVPYGSTVVATATCPAGKKVVGCMISNDSQYFYPFYDVTSTSYINEIVTSRPPGTESCITSFYLQEPGFYNKTWYAEATCL